MLAKIKSSRCDLDCGDRVIALGAFRLAIDPESLVLRDFRQRHSSFPCRYSDDFSVSQTDHHHPLE